jgi:putative DNA base modification enzyme with NMAD domain
MASSWEAMSYMPKLFSYVVEHDRGHAPNPYFRLCTLCRCKFRESSDKPKNLVEKANKGDWVIGTGGANLKWSAGNGTLIYAMRVDDKPSRQQYFLDRRFRIKKPKENGTFQQRMGDNLRPANNFERREQSVLISRHFFYFGRKAIRIPQNKFPGLECGRGFKYKNFKDTYIARFVKWLETETGFKPGMHGEPCMKNSEDYFERRKRNSCKSSC